MNGIMRIWLALMAAALLLSACTGPAPVSTGNTELKSNLPQQADPKSNPADVQAVVNGNTDFAVSLYQHLATQDGNLFFSPYSISSALAMTYARARGQTQAQMREALHFPFNPDRLSPAFNLLGINLNKLAQNPQDHGFPEFKVRILELGEYLTRELESHIFKEDNILYQIALQVLSPEEWEKVKKECDKIGYCCFTPEDQQKEGNEMVELDLRSIMPFERHDLIFQKWDSLKSGETLQITNDHDPKPLRYQFDAEYKNQFTWEYVQKGPKDWIVRIKRT